MPTDGIQVGDIVICEGLGRGRYQEAEVLTIASSIPTLPETLAKAYKLKRLTGWFHPVSWVSGYYIK